MYHGFQKIFYSVIENYQRISSEAIRVENIVIAVIILTGVALIQIFFPPGTRTISRRAWIENVDKFLRFDFLVIFGLAIPSKYLREYRCPTCHKLLAKGHLKHVEDILEVKCRNCSTICLFKGEDAEIIEKRSILLKEGKIPDPELVK